MRRPALALTLLILTSCLLIESASAQERLRVEALSSELQDAQRGHLWRVGAWGAVNMLGGLALVLASNRQEQPARWGFGAQSAAWGTINLGIATVGLLGGVGETTGLLGDAIASERGYHDILLLNMGLNVAYASIGTAMVVAGYRDVRSAAAWRGHGTALIVQGLGLLVLDGIALWGARSRLADLLGMTGDLSAMPLPVGLRVVLHL